MNSAEYEEIIRTADGEAANGRYKDAYNTLGRVLEVEGPADWECRYRRGLYALRVGNSRLDHFREADDPKQVLIKAACWLSRAEAYMMSACEDASDEDRKMIEADLQLTKQEQARFRQICRDGTVDLFR